MKLIINGRGWIAQARTHLRYKRSCSAATCASPTSIILLTMLVLINRLLQALALTVQTADARVCKNKESSSTPPTLLAVPGPTPGLFSILEYFVEV